jgi:hypothetical protein
MSGSTYTYRITAEGTDAVKAAFSDLGSTLLTFAGVGGLGFMIDNSLKTASSIETMSKQAAMSTSDFQEWAYALQQFNVSQTDAASGMKMLAENAAQFVTMNSGPAKNAFDLLFPSNGIQSSQQQVQQLMADQSNMFAVVLQKLGQIKSASEQIDLSKMFFGKGAGPDFVEPIQAGIDALQQYREEAEQLGIVFSQNTIDDARKAEVEIGNLETILHDKLAIAIDENADKIAHMAQVSIDALPTVIALIDDMLTGMQYTADQAGRLGDNLSAAMGNETNWLAGKMGTPGIQGDMGDHIPPGAIDTEMNKLNQGQSVYDLLGIKDPSSSDGAPQIGDPAAAAQAEKMAEANQKVVQSLQDEVTAMGESDRDLAIVTAQRKLNKDATDDQRQAVADLAGQYYDEKQQMQEVKEASTDIVDAFEDMTLKGQKFGDVIKNLILQLAELAEKSLFQTPTQNGLTSLLNGIFGFSTGSSSVDTSAGQAVSVPRLGSIQSYAVGTDYVPYDMVAQIHKGEKITQTAQNNSGNSGDSQQSSNVFNVDMRGASVDAVARLETLVNKVNGSIENRAANVFQQLQIRTLGK